MESNRPVMLTIKEAAREFDVAVFAVRRWCREGKIQHVMAGNKTLINSQSMSDFLSGK